MRLYHSKCTNILYHNYIAGSSIHCRNYFAVLIVRCTKILAKFIFVALNDYEKFLTLESSRFYCSCFWMLLVVWWLSFSGYCVKYVIGL